MVRDLTQIKPRVDLVDCLLNRGPGGRPCSTATFTPTCGRGFWLCWTEKLSRFMTLRTGANPENPGLMTQISVFRPHSLGVEPSKLGLFVSK